MSTTSTLPQNFETPGQTPAEAPGRSSWKEEVNRRLAAHRSRRASDEADNQQPTAPMAEEKAENQDVAARVAARYANRPSFSELLAQEARNAARAAEQAANAARDAHAAAQAMLAGLGEPLEAPAEEMCAPAEAGSAPAPTGSAKEQSYTVVPAASQPAYPRYTPAEHYLTPSLAARMAADESLGRISGLRQDPLAQSMHLGDGLNVVEAVTISPDEPIPGNLIEFPRQLVAARRARPRHAEGPLRDEDYAQEHSQLRIFEVEPEEISQQLPEAVEQVAAAEQIMSAPAPDELPVYGSQQEASLEANSAYTDEGQPLDENNGAEHHHEDLRRPREESRALHQEGNAPWTPLRAEKVYDDAIRGRETVHKNDAGRPEPTRQFDTATIEDRLISGLVDLAVIGIGFLLFVGVFVACTAHPPTGLPAWIASGIALTGFAFLYLYLFFGLSDGTPGMRYARIALCTFDDDNPTRKQMRKRIPLMMLSALPLGLGFAWALLDKEHLGWHDRLTRTYQRSYR